MDEDTTIDVKEEKGAVEEIKITEPKRRDYFLPASILAAGLMISGSIVYLVGAQHAPASGAANPALAPTPTPAAAVAAPSVSSTDVILGDANAPVTLIEYGDYQCPFCAQFFSGAEAQIRSQYVKTGEVRMVFRDFAFIDRFPGVPAGANESHDAAAAASCAKDQGKFWEYHDALYNAKIADVAKGGSENDGFFNRAEFLALAQNVGLNAAAFTSCIDSGKYKAQVDADTAAAEAGGVQSTPTVFVNKQEIQGAQPFAQFQTAIETALKSK